MSILTSTFKTSYRKLIISKLFKEVLFAKFEQRFRLLSLISENDLASDSSFVLDSLSSRSFRSSLRSISDSQLNTLRCLHPCPIYLVLFKGSYVLMHGISHLGVGFTLRCLQRLSRPDKATRRWIWYPTGTPEVRPTRSSRTRVSSPQISSARAG